MPREERLSTRLDALLEAVFESPSDPFSLYWDIAGHLGRGDLAPAQKMIRRKLKEKGSIGPESVVLVSCVMSLSGFPPARILHFLSLYLAGGIRLSLFELAVSAIFLGEPPIPASVLYDLTQYTYLEKRLLVRKSLEIAEKLKDLPGPPVMLYLYLLSLRDDLSNENVQLIALVLKTCFPSHELRTRIGSASLEEYGEIARALRTAQQHSLELLPGGGSGARAPRSFDRDSASFFLDKYFSDEALARVRAAAPDLPKPPARRRAAPPPSGERPASEHGSPGSAAARVHRSGIEEPPPAVRPRSSGRRSTGPAETATQAGSQTAARAAASSGRSGRRHRNVGGEADSRSPGPAVLRPALLLSALPTALAAVVLAIVFVAVPAGLHSGREQPVPAVASPSAAEAVPSAPPGVTAGEATPADHQEAAGSPAPPPETTYVVQPGDSLWKIFTSMRGATQDHAGWTDFLSTAQSVNHLGDPDRLQPGRVLQLPPR